jgi:hypothetical protein
MTWIVIIVYAKSLIIYSNNNVDIWFDRDQLKNDILCNYLARNFLQCTQWCIKAGLTSLVFQALEVYFGTLQSPFIRVSFIS